MSAGRLQLFDKRASLRDRTSRLLIRCPTASASCACASSAPSRRRGSSCCALDGRSRPTRRCDARPRGVARPAAARASCSTPAAAALAAARPARDRRHRPHVGRRDPVDRAKLSPFKRGDDLDDEEAAALREAIVDESSAARSSTTRRSSRCRSPTSSRCRCGPPPPGRAVPALRHDARGRLLRGLRDDLLPALSQTGGPGAQGPPAVAAAEVEAPDFELPDQDGNPVRSPTARAAGRPLLLSQGRHARLHDAGVRHPRPPRRLRRGRRACSASRPTP
jgi:hypothetical protein